MSNGRTHSTLLGTVLLLVTASAAVLIPPPHNPTSVSSIAKRTPRKFLPQDLCTCCAPSPAMISPHPRVACSLSFKPQSLYGSIPGPPWRHSSSPYYLIFSNLHVCSTP